MLENEAVSGKQVNPLPPSHSSDRLQQVPVTYETSFLKEIFGEGFDESDQRVKTFTERLCRELEPDTPAPAVVGQVVRTAIEVEFGADGIKTLGLERFLILMTEAICHNQDMLERTIALASKCLRVKLGIEGQPKQ